MLKAAVKYNMTLHTMQTVLRAIKIVIITSVRILISFTYLQSTNFRCYMNKLLIFLFLYCTNILLQCISMYSVQICNTYYIVYIHTVIYIVNIITYSSISARICLTALYVEWQTVSAKHVTSPACQSHSILFCTAIFNFSYRILFLPFDVPRYH